MENLLLALDDFDDALGALIHLVPGLLSFLIAIVVFVLTVVTFLFIPAITWSSLAVLVCCVLLDRVRRRQRTPLQH